METTRPSLLERLRDPNDQGAWREFEETYRDLVLRYCHRRGLQHWDAEDVLQTVLLGLTRAMGGFRYDPRVGRFRGYLGRVVGNAIVNRKRRPGEGARHLEQEALAELAVAEGAEQDRRWEDEWRLHHLRRAMGKIRESARDRDLEIFERLLAGESVAGVAEALGLTPDAVYKVKQRIRDRVRAHVAAQIREEDGLPRNGEDAEGGGDG